MNKKISTHKPSGSNTNLDELMGLVSEDVENELLTEPAKRFPVDLHPKIHREVGELQLRITTPEGKKVSNRMLVTEALLDLFKKYEEKSENNEVKTDYQFNRGDTFKSKL